MKYADVLALRDNTIRDFLNSHFPASVSDQEKLDFGALFDRAVKVANDDVEVQLRDLFGKDAERILKRKRETEQTNL